MKISVLVPTIIAAATFSTYGQAALPPQYQRAAELKAVIDAAAEVLEGKMIDTVTFTDDDLYAVEADGCTLVVSIKDIEPEPAAVPMVGPRQFEAIAEAPVCE